MNKLFSIPTIVLAGSILLHLTVLCFRSHGAVGDVDLSFDASLSVTNPVSVVVVQPDGKVLIGGPLTFSNGTNGYGSARLNANGSVDSAFVPRSFEPDIGYLGFPYDYRELTAFAVQPDGKVLVAAYYYEQFDCDDFGCRYNYRFSITRHHADGTRDPNFEPAVQNTHPPDLEFVSALGMQSDGKIVVGGRFASIKGVTRSGLARLTASGSLDTNFVGQVPLYYTASAVVVQPNDNLMIVSTAGGGIGQLARLNANGSYDLGFNPGPIIGNNTGSYPDLSSVAVQSDGKVLIGGSFTNVSGTTRNRIARLNADGSLDSSFNPGTGANGAVRTIALRSDGKLLVGGDFTTVNGVVRPHLARLFGDATAPALGIARSNATMIVSWPETGLNFQLQESTNFSVPNSWSPVEQPAITNAGQISISLPTTVGSQFFRLKSQ